MTASADRTFASDCPLVNSRERLGRALGRSLRQRYGAGNALREAVSASARELRSQGLNEAQTLSVLAGLVEDAGRTHGADRLDLVSGQPRWMPIRTRVLEWARLALQLPVGAE